MQLSILVDNNAVASGTEAEGGLSLLLSAEGIRILFDTGERTLMRNVEKLTVDLTQLTHIVLSHGHFDHTSGLPDLIKFYESRHISPLPKLICHPDAFDRRALLSDITVASVYVLHSPLTKDQVIKHFPTEFSREPMWIHQKIVFLGEIPRNPEVDEECLLGHIEKNSKYVKDHIIDDSALVYKSSEGLVIISGCAHSGICNTIEYAKKVCGEDRIVDIVGGFHLRDAKASRISHVRRYMEKVHPQSLHACHCTGDGRATLPKQKNVGVGTILSYVD